MALNTHQPHLVYTRQLWGDDWFLRDHLYAEQFSFACGPDMSDAVLTYKYGRIMRPGQQSFADYTPLDLGDRYVKIVVTDGPTWYGVCIDQSDNRQGEATYGGNEILTGTQTFICRGLEYLLHRKIIDTSVVKTAGGEERIDRAIAFNLGGGLPSSSDRQGNATVGFGANGARIFAQTLTDAIAWNGFDILDYLVKYQFPADRGGNDSFGWSLNNPFTALDILSPHEPAIHAHGKSFFQLLNELVDRRRLHGWYLVVDPVLERPEIKLFTFNTADIILPDASRIPANNSQAAWDFDQENQVQSCTLDSDVSGKYDKVIARGEPQGGCFTVSFTNGLLEIDWTTAQQTTYDAGDPTVGAAPNDIDAHAWHQEARRKDYIKKVYSYFRISPDTFDGYAGTGGLYAVWPDQANVNPLVNSRLSWWPGLRLQDRLPLKTEHNYAAPPATNNQKDASKWEYRRPFVFVTDSGTGKATRLDKSGRGPVSEELESAGRFWACSLRMQDDAFGFIVDTGGAPQHIIAENTYNSPDDADLSDYQPAVDYNYMSATVFAEGDGFVEKQWPEVIIANPDTLKELIIDVPNARLDYLLPGTVWDIDTDGQPLVTAGGYVQDDTAFLANVARSAYEWYSAERKAMQLTLHSLEDQKGRGDLITVIGGANNAQTINSVVTKIQYDTRAGNATYLTQFAELDL